MLEVQLVRKQAIDISIKKPVLLNGDQYILGSPQYLENRKALINSFIINSVWVWVCYKVILTLNVSWKIKEAWH